MTSYRMTAKDSHISLDLPDAGEASVLIKAQLNGVAVDLIDQPGDVVDSIHALFSDITDGGNDWRPHWQALADDRELVRHPLSAGETRIAVQNAIVVVSLDADDLAVRIEDRHGKTIDVMNKWSLADLAPAAPVP